MRAHSATEGVKYQPLTPRQLVEPTLHLNHSTWEVPLAGGTGWRGRAASRRRAPARGTKDACLHGRRAFLGRGGREGLSLIRALVAAARVSTVRIRRKL